MTTGRITRICKCLAGQGSAMSFLLFSLLSLALAGILVFQFPFSSTITLAATYTQDTFSRVVNDGWGTTETGATWYSSGGTAAEYLVDGSAGVHDVTQPGSSRNSWVEGGQIDLDLKYRFKTSQLAGGESLYQFALLRVKDADNYYGARVKLLPDQRVKAVFIKRVNKNQSYVGSETEVGRETHTADNWYWVRAQAEGINPTALRLKVWRAGTPEPEAWDYEAFDSEGSLQVAGGVGVQSVTHSRTSNTPVRYSYDDLTSSLMGSSDPTPLSTATLHVDPVNGSDSNTGSAESPFRTIQQALDVVQPGTAIKLASGIYREANQTVTAGTASAPIIIEPETGAMPILDGDNNALDAIRVVHSYYTIRNLDIRNTKEGVRLEGVTGVVLENNVIHHVSNEGIRLRYFAIGNTVRNNTIYGCGLNGNGEGIYIGTAPEQRYRNNGEPDTSINNMISGNEIYDVEEGIDIKEDSSFNTIENNRIHGATDPNSGGINVRADENYIYSNRSYNNAGAGFRFGGDVTYSSIYGNNYHYGVSNVLRNNVSNDNAGYGYKFMNGPQDADTDSTGFGNAGELYHYGSRVVPFISSGDTTPPAGSITINGDAENTNSTAVALTLSASDLGGAVNHMQFSNDNAAYSSPELYQTSKLWTLTAGDGTKTVYVKYADDRDNWSPPFSDTIILDTSPPVLSGLSAIDIGTRSATIVWTTDEPSDSLVEYGINNSYGLNQNDASLVTGHRLTLTGLSPATTYHYQIASGDTMGNASRSTDLTFTTAALPAVGITSLAISLAWTSPGWDTAAFVQVMDRSGNPVTGAIVNITWNIDGVVLALSGTTNGLGEVRINPGRFEAASGAVVTATVTGVAAHPDYVYESATDIEMSVTVP